MTSLVGFSGSRSLCSSSAPLVGGLIASVLQSGRGVAVGCAPGLDSLVRSSCSSARVFRAASYSPADLVARSCLCVRSVAASGAGAGWVSFPDCRCPSGLAPSSVDSFCFCGLGSGSWASAALAVGLEVPLVVFGVPSSSLPSSWGSWAALSSGAWSGGFMLSPAPVRCQLSLF